MESTWGLAIFMWISIITGFVAICIHEFRKTPEQKKVDIEKANERREKELQSRRIVKVIPLGVSGKQFKRGGVKGALFGGFIGGVPGAVMGAMMHIGKSTPVQSFLVKYGDGKTEVRQCFQDSSERKALMKRIAK